MATRRALRVAALGGACLAVACVTWRGRVSPTLEAAMERRDPLAVADALEALIAEGQDSPADREYAYAAVTRDEGDTAAYAFARAILTGRFVQQRGLLGASLVGDVEDWALRSRELDPTFRDGAATRLLGTLWVLAPASLLGHGDSERGLELLVALVRDHPDRIENHLRLAEAYVALHDPEPAGPHLCVCLADSASLRRDEQELLEQLVAVAGTPSCPTSSRPLSAPRRRRRRAAPARGSTAPRAAR
jgi:hypothetical protein